MALEFRHIGNTFKLFRVADPGLDSITGGSPGAGLNLPVVDRRLVTFLERPRKVTQRRPPLMSRAFAFLALLAEFGVSQNSLDK